MIFRDDKIRSSTKLYKILVYLFICYMNIENVSSSRLYNRLYSVAGFSHFTFTFKQGCARDLFGRDRDQTETETLQVAETLPRRLVKSSKQSPQVAAYRDN